jgi:hypothetical protein
MSEVTQADRETAAALCTDLYWPHDMEMHVHAVAAALAAERAKARTPFLALADELERTVEWQVGGMPKNQASHNAYQMASRIRRAAEEQQ